MADLTELWTCVRMTSHHLNELWDILKRREEDLQLLDAAKPLKESMQQDLNYMDDHFTRSGDSRSSGPEQSADCLGSALFQSSNASTILSRPAGRVSEASNQAANDAVSGTVDDAINGTAHETNGTIMEDEMKRLAKETLKGLLLNMVRSLDQS